MQPTCQRLYCLAIEVQGTVKHGMNTSPILYAKGSARACHVKRMGRQGLLIWAKYDLSLQATIVGGNASRAKAYQEQALAAFTIYWFQERRSFMGFRSADQNRITVTRAIDDSTHVKSHVEWLANNKKGHACAKATKACTLNHSGSSKLTLTS